MSELIGINLNINQIQINNNYLIANQREVEKKNIEQKTVELISDLLRGICDKNESQPINFNSNILKPFTTKTRPSISIKDYLLRLSKFTKMEESTMILVLIYIDRICNYNKIQLLYQNIFKIILASAFVAIKFNEDIHYSLEVYAKIGGVPPSELEYLEFHFLILIKFALNVNKTLYDKYSESLTSFQDDDEEEEEEENEEEENL
jgi:hypothetical protein